MQVATVETQLLTPGFAELYILFTGWNFQNTSRRFRYLLGAYVSGAGLAILKTFPYNIL